MTIHIGNLNIMTTARQLAELFRPFGNVSSSRIIAAGPKGRSNGSGLVEIERFCGNRAVRMLHRQLFMNSYIDVKEVFV
ncbi:MAG TPA: RNA-binding protein [Puia sp.]|nr:RNA-binding protein [Puia sp.]